MLTSFSSPAGELGHHAEAAVGDGGRTPAAVRRLLLASERLLGRGGRPGHHEQPAGRDQRGQIRSCLKKKKQIQKIEEEESEAGVG